MFGSHTFVPICWMCKKQTSVSHSSTDAEIVSLEANLRMGGIPALGLWYLAIEVLHSSSMQSKKSIDQVRGNSSRNTTSNKHTQKQTKTPAQHDNVGLCNVHNNVSLNGKSSRFGSMLYIFEDNEAVINMIIRGRSPTMRHVFRTLRVAYLTIKLDPKIQIKYVDTNSQTYRQGNFPCDEWNSLLRCCSQNFSSASSTKTIAKRMQESRGL